MMDIETIWKFGTTLPHVSTRSPFGPDSLSLEVGGKIFALFDLSGENNFYNVKTSKNKSVELRERYACIHTAYHMNKDSWISVDFDGNLSDSMHRSLLVDSYREVLRAMSRKKRHSLLSFEIRPTIESDIPRILEIFVSAKTFMRSQGITVQWTGDYPGEEAVRKDMEKGWSMVMEHCGEVVGTFCMMTESEPTYHNLYCEEEYVTLHRVASNGCVSGIVDAAIDYAATSGKAVRIDTHCENKAMLRCIKRLKMRPIGEVTIADGTPRLVFELRSVSNG